MKSNTVKIHVGDCLESLRNLPSNSVHCCVTSPPYYNLRSYLDDSDPNKPKELGMEDLPDCAGWATGVRCGSCYV